MNPHSVGRLIRGLFTIPAELPRSHIIIVLTTVVWIMLHSYGRKEGSEAVRKMWNVRVPYHAPCSVMSRDAAYLRLDGRDKRNIMRMKSVRRSGISIQLCDA